MFFDSQSGFLYALGYEKATFGLFRLLPWKHNECEQLSIVSLKLPRHLANDLTEEVPPRLRQFI